MEKLNNESAEKQGSGDEGGGVNQIDEQPTTSRAENIPERNAHNMNDFKSLDFNSADEVRQAMKAVLNGHLPPQSFSEEANQTRMKALNKSDPVEIPELANKTHTHDLRKTVQRQVQQNLYRKMKSTAKSSTGSAVKSPGLKRRGRPMKAGPSRSVKAPSVRKSVLYIGKLSNVVQFTRRWTSESASDGDSVVFY
ncbi:hypothetical protein PYW08_011666 [Mythimna loreyi]|uniref:Uncharacterized protein n=1 Tax=Mythimna loreyi TaxID=667449 RepID=A0ACC2QK61_9NEOP|nr:hypothetical protein PYW08_011666 [Mythimna loreyi]